MGVPGTDLRSIKDYEPIPALLDMEAVEATGGQASNIGNEGEQEMDEGMMQEIMALVQQIGPEVAIQALTTLAQNPEAVQAMSSAGGPPGAPGMAPAGPQGALSGLQV
jgi:hypothetical protein